jgi:phosphatidylserine decarboxylase
MMAFDTVSSATSIWIKGRDFSVAKLLGPNYKDVADRYEGGALGIFRLAPQDYHRFHSPVSGTVGKMTMIEGEYYTVNPQAIRTSLDVYGENVRKVVPIDSPDFGLVMTVWVGAMSESGHEFLYVAAKLMSSGGKYPDECRGRSKDCSGG